jgi:putative phosphoribosyl transferase
MQPRSTDSSSLVASNGAVGTCPPPPLVVRIPPLALHGLLHVPADATGVVVLVLHASCALPVRVRDVLVGALNSAGLATLSVDVLLPHEAAHRHKAFDRMLVVSRLASVLDWLAIKPRTRSLPVGLFAVGSGTAAAMAMAAIDGRIDALVMADGRLDLAGYLPGMVAAPTLLVAGAADPVIARINQRTHASMHCERSLELLRGQALACGGITALAATAARACDWFRTHLRPRFAAQALSASSRSAGAADGRPQCGHVALSIE